MQTVTLFLVIAVMAAAIIYLRFKYLSIKNQPEAAENPNVMNLNPANFSQHTRNGVVLIDFWASWCMPCKMMAPILNEVADEVSDKAVVAKVNVEEHQQLSARFSVRNIPTLVLLKNGKEINRFVGIKPRNFLVNEIKKAL